MCYGHGDKTGNRTQYNLASVFVENRVCAWDIPVLTVAERIVLSSAKGVEKTPKSAHVCYITQMYSVQSATNCCDVSTSVCAHAFRLPLVKTQLAVHLTSICLLRRSACVCGTATATLSAWNNSTSFTVKMLRIQTTLLCLLGTTLYVEAGLPCNELTPVSYMKMDVMKTPANFS